MVMHEKCDKCKHLEDECRAEVQAAIDSSLESFGHGSADGKARPGRVRRFEQVKMIEREFHELSDADFAKARDDISKVMKKYRGDD